MKCFYRVLHVVSMLLLVMFLIGVSLASATDYVIMDQVLNSSNFPYVLLGLFLLVLITNPSFIRFIKSIKIIKFWDLELQLENRIETFDKMILRLAEISMKVLSRSLITFSSDKASLKKIEEDEKFAKDFKSDFHDTIGTEKIEKMLLPIHIANFWQLLSRDVHDGGGKLLFEINKPLKREYKNVDVSDEKFIEKCSALLKQISKEENINIARSKNYFDTHLLKFLNQSDKSQP